MSNSSRKRPYDNTPITRDYNNVASKSSSKKGTTGFFVVSLILVITAAVIMLVLFTKPTSSTIYANYYINASDSVSEIAANKAKLSAVCIGVGGSNNNGSFSKDNIPTFNQMFTNVASRGSGVIISLDKHNGEAYILTCHHVISSYPNAVFVALIDSYNPIYAEVVGYSAANDIAVVKIASDQLKTTISVAATIADSTYISTGDVAIAVGNPQGFGFAVTTGHISRSNIMVSTNSNITIRTLQIDTAINSGNSGGGLFNKSGDLIGIVESKNTNNGIDNVAFAVHINTAISIANNIISGRNLAYAPAGYTLAVESSNKQFVDGKIYDFNKVVVTSVSDSSDAARAGLRAGDLLVSVKHNQKLINFNTEFIYDEIKYSIALGDTVEYVVLRGNTTKTITFTVTSLAA